MCPRDHRGLALFLLLSACGSTTPGPATPTDAAGGGALDAAAVEDAGAADARPAADANDPVDASLAEDTGAAEDASAAPDAAASPPTRASVTFQTADGVQIAATLVTAGASPAGSPGVVLVHQYRQSMQQWGQYPERLAAAGYRVLAFDLRGHGASGPYARPIDQLLTDPQGAPRDVAAAFRYLADQGGADPARIGVVGTSIGANLAVAAAIARLPATAVALSPRIPPTESLAQSPANGMTSVFYLAAANDAGGQAADCRTMHTATTEPRSLLIIPGVNSHGIELLTRHPEVEVAVRAWLDERLR